MGTTAREYRRTPTPASNIRLFSWPDRGSACIGTPQIGPEITIILVLPLGQHPSSATYSQVRGPLRLPRRSKTRKPASKGGIRGDDPVGLPAVSNPKSGIDGGSWWVHGWICPLWVSRGPKTLRMRATAHVFGLSPAYRLPCQKSVVRPAPTSAIAVSWRTSAGIRHIFSIKHRSGFRPRRDPLEAGPRTRTTTQSPRRCRFSPGVSNSRGLPSRGPAQLSPGDAGFRPARPTRSGSEDQSVYPIAPVAAVFARRDLEMGGRAPGGTRLRSDSAT